MLLFASEALDLTTFTDIEDEYEICEVFGYVDYPTSGTVFWQGQVTGGFTFAF
jgi:hypothetical protein